MAELKWRSDTNSFLGRLQHLIAIMQASRQRASTSAPVTLLSNKADARPRKSRSGSTGILANLSLKISIKSSILGIARKICCCKRPGRSSAASTLPMRFVQAITKTRLFCVELETPSISFKRVERMRDEKSPASASSRFEEIESMSSKKMMHGAADRALANTALSSDSDPPSHLSKISVARTWITGNSNDAAKHLAACVLPVPDMPWKRIPGGGSNQDFLAFEESSIVSKNFFHGTITCRYAFALTRG
mmetsp:Transcript_10766/g.17209  ORF Transcript_10766/g.17209 Transcript_10766/m.17209 type:complete len:248 (+) Transcript_10766:992-1735(+)